MKSSKNQVSIVKYTAEDGTNETEVVFSSKAAAADFLESQGWLPYHAVPGYWLISSAPWRRASISTQAVHETAAEAQSFARALAKKERARRQKKSKAKKSVSRKKKRS